MRRTRSRPIHRFLQFACIFASTVLCATASASQQSGKVTFNGLPVPGASITATQGTKKVTTASDADGNYRFADLPDGAWTIDIEMVGFAKLEQGITVNADQPGIRWELKMLPLDQVIAQTKAVQAPIVVAAAATPASPTPAAKGGAQKGPEPEAPKPQSEEAAQANDGFLVNGSVNNAATSQFSLAQAFGNTRKGSKSLYTGGLGLVFDNSALDARTYSLSGVEQPKLDYNRATLTATLGGPIRIPHVMPRGPNFFVGYQWQRDSTAESLTGLVPTADQRNGILPGGNVSPISPQAQALLALYPLPNVASIANYNYQVPVLNDTHQDSMQLRLDKGVTRRDQLYGGFAFQRTRAGSTNFFGFADKTNTLGINGNITWQHRMNRGLYLTTNYRVSRLRNMVSPFFSNRTNISGAAGITGNDQDPQDWGPPTLSFSSGIYPLSDGVSAFNRNRTESVSPSLEWYHGRHNVTAGGDFRRQEYNYRQQGNPRGTFTFTGAQTGVSDFADFLRGLPDTSSLAFGNANKYLRQSVYDLYATDDWRLRPELTLNVGVRWEYGAPITEINDQLGNLDVAADFSREQPVFANNRTGPVTGQHYPNSLIRPDKTRVEPRIAVSWRPIAGSSLVVRAGYGIYSDTSVYQATALQFANQAPLAKNVTVQNTPACPQTLANGFNSCTVTTADTFGVDPNFRVGFAQTWQLAIQRDLPAAMQMTATYLGIKGSNGVQQFLPNTYALGAANPCPLCPVGFQYRTSNGSSNRQSGNIQLRRRLRSGFTATAQYTFSKAIDDDSILGGQGSIAAGATSSTGATASVAQNWLDLHAERSRSSFDQRHLLTANLQYTTGMGIGGGTLMTGWRGRVLKEWTGVATISAGSGLPETPVYLAAVNGTGFTGPLRPDVAAGTSVYAASTGRFLNASAFAAPKAGQFGNAGRYSITGPAQFTFNASLARTFRLDKKFNLDVRADATNLLNHGVFTTYNTALNPVTASAPTLALSSPLFGLPTAVNAMRSIQMTARLRF
ncbi:MAG TPA: TonB-dependent receptor [Acidobacteriaceae bacterium]|jgi:outer membrane receptor protein involved in Fe transport